jgi:adenosylmethionine-8-amino-7-oxononanoate aminotransferase
MTAWLEKDSHWVWHPFTSLVDTPSPLHVVKAHGPYLYTDSGRRILDGISSWWVNIHGHSHPELAQAIFEQACTLEHVIFAGFTHSPAIELAEKLIALLPGQQQKVFFSDNGSTAVEVAIKMAIQYWYNRGTPRKKIIAIQGAYHGDTFGAMSVGDRNAFTEAFSQHLFDVEFIDWPGHRDEHRATDQFENLLKSDEVAAFIYEPLIQGAAGMRTYTSHTLNALLVSARKRNVICIADEVFTGFGRTGKMFASEYLDVNPDIICLSKGLTGGVMPLGVTACSQRIVEAYLSSEPKKTFFHGHSFTANPLGCAVALKSLELLTMPACQENIQTISAKQQAFAERVNGLPGIARVNRLGTILSIEIETASGGGYFNNIRQKIYDHFLQRDILLRPLGNVLYFLPSYAFSSDQINHVHQTIFEFLESLQSIRK